MSQRALLVNSTLEIAGLGDSATIFAVVFEEDFELHEGRESNGHTFENWRAVVRLVRWLVKEAMPSLSSSDTVVSVPVSASSSSPPSSGCHNPVAGGSVNETSEKPLLSLADMPGKTARVMAARRQRGGLSGFRSICAGGLWTRLIEIEGLGFLVCNVRFCDRWVWSAGISVR